MTKHFTITNPDIRSQVLEQVQAELMRQKVPSKQAMQSVLLAEEVLVELEKVCPGNPIDLSVSNGSKIRIRARGEKLDLAQLSLVPQLDTQDYDPQAEAAIRSVILQSFRDKLRCKWIRGVNIVDLTVKNRENSSARTSITCILAGLAVGLLIRGLMPQAVTAWIAGNVLDVVYTMFLNGVMMFVGPMVFFSMASCISGFRDMSTLGRISVKVIALYLITTVFAVLVGFSVFFLFRPGDASLAAMLPETVEIADAGTVSLRSTVVNLIPSNFVLAFANFDLIQIMVMGIAVGASVGLLGQYSNGIQTAMEAMNTLFIQTVTLITRFMPAAIFCAIAKMVMSIAISTMAELVKVTLCVLLGMVCMMGVYCLLLKIMTGLRVRTFLRKFSEVITTAFSLCASSATMPTNMRVLGEKIGVSPKIYSFSIPLGTTINMDGFCIYLSVCTLALLKTAGLELTSGVMMTLLMSIVLISLGAPGVPGVGVVCIAMILRQLGLPDSLAVLMMPVIVLLDAAITVNNVTGDAVVTTIVAKSEHLLDEDVFNS